MTLSLALAPAALAACTESHDPIDSVDRPVADGGGRDAGTDAGRGPDRDGICDSTGTRAWEDADCCDRIGGFWSPGGGCGVPGPFVPPTMVG